VREAFGRLTKEGLLVHKARRGVFVASPSAEEFDDIAHVRVALEQLVVELASKNWDAEATRSVQGLVDGMAEAANENDAERFFELDSRFHDVFWQVANSPILLEIAALLRGRLSGFIREAILRRTHDELLEAVTMHQEWLDAVATGDISTAKDEVQRQIESTSRQIVASLEEVEGRAGG
jgi:DNA-binding GntR family transcriptional regulator